MSTVDLGDHITNQKVSSLIGKKKGLDVREAEKLDLLDIQKDTVRIVIPNNINAIAPSFFLGMFSKSLAYFKTPEVFFNHYDFETNDFHRKQVADCVDDYFVASLEIEKLLEGN